MKRVNRFGPLTERWGRRGVGGYRPDDTTGELPSKHNRTPRRFILISQTPGVSIALLGIHFSTTNLEWTRQSEPVLWPEERPSEGGWATRPPLDQPSLPGPHPGANHTPLIHLASSSRSLSWKSAAFPPGPAAAGRGCWVKGRGLERGSSKSPTPLITLCTPAGRRAL